MSKLQKHILCIAAVLILAASPIFWRFVSVRYRVRAATNPQPFTIQQHNEITGPRVGQSAVFEIRTIAVRSDGSRADLTKEPRKGWITRDLEFSNGKIQKIYDEVKVFSTMQLSPSENDSRLKSRRDLSSNCLTPIGGKSREARPSRLLGSDMRFGISVVKVFTGSNLTVLMAPSLGCVTVEHVVDWDASKPATNKSELKVDSINLGEPDSSLFEVPVDYKQVLPSQAEAFHLQFAKVPDSAVQKNAAQVAAHEDPFYLSHRPPSALK